jgi:lipoprotein NlpD
MWQWPVEGNLVQSFGADTGLGNGIGIGGSLGQTIHAAASGQVVYAGNGLIGYGQLLIIKHNDTYLSAYGHNDRLIVGQGDTVERGESIAEMGFGPDQLPQLHFEIRRNGSPVDPLRHLPR